MTGSISGPVCLRDRVFAALAASVSVPLRRAPRELQQIKTAGREHSLRKPAKGNQGQCEELLMLPLKKGLDLTKVCLLTC